ncbi:hypothetical protein SS1G_05827 [Sclerotinia sclerotiorum 1980 UF-70]|uniref:Transglycosylase SLT domain-containing protein n=2 Tax=Sclerotinia sclerotiorum (strain ATCC 18683 / 1980 / Ss-1) TaxID=665079 RepID=A7EKI0_SCLS1|nr:hypothetical protein SS1G_05827 [Sclerotinia sclerotiorum 1980 UF-70]APA09917.1 hypothetical protein sscle_05g046870 [Sclerotinia sclerotiorum 1980 UF-70]EDO03346.1 hypothetical protein SS1G_05827 [Sclerotinia sclerotiorum 1980 UF-70]
MFSKALIIALAMRLGASAAPTSVAEPTAGSLVGRYVPYQRFTGDGSHWSSMSAWTSFDTMWDNSQAFMTTSCTQFGGTANNSPAEIADIKYAISSISGSSGIDPRFILAIIMQESGASIIAGMIRDGSTGTLGQPGGGDGLQQCLAQSGSPYSAQGAYVAARIYNSGSYAWGTDLGTP